MAEACGGGCHSGVLVVDEARRGKRRTEKKVGMRTDGLVGLQSERRKCTLEVARP